MIAAEYSLVKEGVNNIISTDLTCESNIKVSVSPAVHIILENFYVKNYVHISLAGRCMQ